MTELKQARRCLQRVEAAFTERKPTAAESRQVEYLARFMQRLYGLVYDYHPEAVGTAQDFGDVDGVKR